MRKTILLTLALTACLAAQVASAQTVGINTTTPDPSAALDIKDPQRGVLLPRVVLKSKNDNTAVINPATGLLLYNLGVQMYAGAGFYYNEGTPASPSWRSVSDLKLPYVSVGTQDVMMDFQNYGNASSTTMHLSNVQGYALSTQGKIKIGLPNQTPGLGKVLTSDASGNATWEGGIAFRASGIMGGTKEVASGGAGEIIVPFSVQEYDLGSNYNDESALNYKSALIAPKKGVYHFDAAISWDYDFDYEDQITIMTFVKQTGVAMTEVGSISGKQGQMSLSLAMDLLLDVNDKIFVKVRHTASQKSITLKSPSFFSGRMMIAQ